MNTESMKWDQMETEFTEKARGKMKPHVADNVVLAWPVMMQIINDSLLEKSRVLDYGCGTGAFCRHMRSKGLRVEGIDFSPAMIRTAVKRSSRNIHYHLGGKEALANLNGKFDVIVSVMAFQFMNDFESYLPLFRELLNDRGLVVFAVHNPEFVDDCFREKLLFRSVRSSGKLRVALMEMKEGVFIDTYLRSKETYRELFEKHGFEYISSRYPQFTQEFIDEYRWKLPSDNAEFLIMSLRKKMPNS